MSRFNSAQNHCPDTAQQFWKNFRNAVKEMTHFPFLIINSINDESDKQSIQRSQFDKAWLQLLHSYPGEGLSSASMKQLVVSNQTLTPKQCAKSGRQFTVGLWFFHLHADGWKFIRAYTEEN